VNAKIYIGVHTTLILDDEYMGSGKVIKRAIEKYSTDNFRKDILEFFEDAKTMYAREKEIVTDEFLLREDVYNLRRGGHGGFDYIRTLPEYSNWTKQGGKIVNNPVSIEKIKERNEHIKKFNKIGSDAYLKKLKENNGKAWWENSRGFLGKSHSNETKSIMSYKAKERLKDPTKNSQFGTMWITNDISNKKIFKGAVIPIGWKKGRIIKSEL
jgi:hypothetical protein